jgi:hypothetical protein
MKQNIKTSLGVIIILIIAATVGIFIYKIEKNQPESAQQTGFQTRKSTSAVKQPSAQSNSEISNNNQNYIEIKELGFKIPIDASMVGELTYKIVKPEGISYSSVQFSSKTGDCDAGMIDKISGTPEKNVTGESEFFTGRTSDIKQFDGYFLFHRTPQAVSCPAKYADMQQKILQAISDGFRNVVLVGQSAITNETIFKSLLEKKYGVNSVKSITSLQSTENFMRGEFDTFASKEDLDAGRDTGGGGIFLAAKVNGEWKIVFDGNGQIECKIFKPYNFPSNMISDCVNS